MRLKSLSRTLMSLFVAAPSLQASGQSIPVPAGVLPIQVPETARVTLAQARAIALANNPQRTLSDFTVRSARDNLSSQSAILNPTVQFSGVNNSVASLNFRNPGNYVVAGVIETSGRRSARTQVARAQYEGAQADARGVRLTLEQGVTAAYIALQGANLALESEKQAYADAQRISDLTANQFKLGAAPETNAINARIALEQELNNLTTVSTAVEQDRAALNQAMGHEPSAPIDTADDAPFVSLTAPLADLQDRALRNRPELESAQAAGRALRATVKLQRAQYYPDVYAQTSARLDGIFLGLSMPLFDFGSIRGAVRKASDDARAQEAQIHQVRQQVKLDVEMAWLTARQAQAQVVRSRDEIVPRAQSVFMKIEQGYRLGGNTILDLLNAQATLRATRNDYNAALASYRQALSQLERAVGGPIN